jgi:hypothetical protein
MPSFDPSNQANIEHGADVVHEDYGDVIAAADVVEGALVGRGVNTSSGAYTVSRTVEVDYEKGGVNSHDSTAAAYLAQFCPEKIHIVDLVISDRPDLSPSHFGLVGGLLRAVGWENYEMVYPPIPVVSAPFDTTSDTQLFGIADLMRDYGSVWAHHFHRGMSTQISYASTHADPRPYPALIVGFEDIGPYDSSILGATVKVGASSWAAPLMGSAVALMKVLDSSLTHLEMIDLIFDNAEDRDGVRWVRLDLAAATLLGGMTSPIRRPRFWSMRWSPQVRLSGVKNVSKIMGVKI